jgi:hypothetical protein
MMTGNPINKNLRSRLGEHIDRLAHRGFWKMPKQSKNL